MSENMNNTYNVGDFVALALDTNIKGFIKRTIIRDTHTWIDDFKIINIEYEVVWLKTISYYARHCDRQLLYQWYELVPIKTKSKHDL